MFYSFTGGIRRDMGKIDAGTALCGLIGNPVGHSISPFIHNTLADKLGINLVYTAFKVESGEVATAVKGAYALGIKGMNVTVPHKQEVMEALVSVDELARSIGAVNTLVRTEGGYKGYNTDYLGIKRQLACDGIDISGREVIILGAGGASRAVTYMCATTGAEKVYLLNRSVDKAEQLACDVNAYVGRNCVYPMALDGYKELEGYKDGTGHKYIVIQTTSKGLYPDVNGTPIEDEAFYDMVEAAADIIFNPSETRFMQLAGKHGARAYNGLEMLLYQGVAAFELWNDLEVSDEQCRELYELMKKEMGQE